MDWNTAIATCAKLGEGWRLPTKEEFNTFFQSGRGIRLLGSYWSSTEANNDEAWGKNYYYHVVLKESEFLYPKREPRQILVVRDLSYKHRGLELVKSRIIGNPIEIDNLLVAQFDYPQNLDWDNANKACQSLGDGWRLPTKDELDTLYKNRTKIGGFFDKSYWSSTEYTSNHACFQNFGNGIQYDGNNHGFKTGNILYVRAVRNKIKAELFVGNPIKSQSVGQSTSQTDLIRRSPSQVCNWKPTRPKLSFVLVDNREACDCCNARFARYSISTTSNIQSKKNQHEIEYINAIMQKHLENSNADKNHIEADHKKFDEFVTKTYGASLLTILQSGLAGYTNMIYSLFGADPIKDTQKKVGRYNIVSDYCSNLCQNRCY
jgi:hypothetical protein